MRLRNLVSAFVVVAVWSLGCSSGTSSSFDPTSSGSNGNGNGNGNASNGDAGSSGSGSTSGNGNPSSGAGGQDASADAPVSSDGGGAGSHDAGAPTGNADGGSGSTADAAPSDGFDEFQHRNLDDINMYRATLGIAPLVLDAELCTFAAAGSLELSQDHLAHQHFINASNDGSLWTSGFDMTAAENQGDPNGWTKLASDPTQNELQQIDAIQLAMFDEGPGTGEAHGHYTNMMDSTSTRLGVGLLEVDGGMLYLTNDFSQ